MKLDSAYLFNTCIMMTLRVYRKGAPSTSVKLSRKVVAEDGIAHVHGHGVSTMRYSKREMGRNEFEKQ
jgi:hypothetical protein